MKNILPSGKMKHRKLAVGALIAAASALIFTGCSSSPSSSSDQSSPTGDIKGNITFQTWALTPKFSPYLNDVIKGFEAKYPGTKVTLQDQPGEGYSDKVVSQANTDTLPDVINIPQDFAYPLAKQDLLLDVSKVDPKLDQTYVKGALDAYKVPGNDGVYAFPWYLNTDISYWNADQMKAAGLDPQNPPKTLDEQLAQAQKMTTASGGKNFLLSSKPGTDVFARAGVPILNEDGTKAAFNTDQAASILQKFVDAYKNGLYPSAVLNDDYLGNSKLFTEGQVAFSSGGGTAYKDFVTNNPSLKGKITMSPALNDSPPLYVQGIAIPTSSKNQATAVAFAQYLLSPENQLKFAELTNTFPSTLASANDPSFSKSDGTPEQDAKVLAFKSLATAKLFVPANFNDKMSTVFGQQIALAMKGDLTPKAALDSAAQQIDKMLENQN